jgi:hypothetical protein
MKGKAKQMDRVYTLELERCDTLERSASAAGTTS